MEKYLHQGKRTGVSGWTFARGSFGVVDSDAEYIVERAGKITRYTYTQNGVRFIVEFLKNENGAILRTDRLINLLEEPMILNAWNSRFYMEGGAGYRFRG